MKRASSLKITASEAYEGQKYWGSEYHLAFRPWQGVGCGKGVVLPPTQSMKKILLVYNLYGNNTV